MASTDQKIEVLGDSPERIYVTDANRQDENVRRHLARYEFAARHIPAGARILDCACGSGYGTEILARSVAGSSVMGVDNCYEALTYAKAHHRHWGTYYILAEMCRLYIEEGSLDAVVSLETLEHVSPESCRQFLCSAACWVRPGGVVVASSPMLRYRDGAPYVTSPYHINELPREDLLAMLADAFPSNDWVRHLHHQKQEAFLPLLEETEGFCVLVARKREAVS